MAGFSGSAGKAARPNISSGPNEDDKQRRGADACRTCGRSPARLRSEATAVSTPSDSFRAARDRKDRFWAHDFTGRRWHHEDLRAKHHSGGSAARWTADHHQMDPPAHQLDKPSGPGRDLGIEAGPIDRTKTGRSKNAGRSVQKAVAQDCRRSQPGGADHARAGGPLWSGPFQANRARSPAARLLGLLAGAGLPAVINRSGRSVALATVDVDRP